MHIINTPTPLTYGEQTVDATFKILMRLRKPAALQGPRFHSCIHIIICCLIIFPLIMNVFKF